MFLPIFQECIPCAPTDKCVPQAANKQGLSATEWANAVSGLVGGKAGGKGATSVGSGTAPDKVDEALEAATKYLEKFEI